MRARRITASLLLVGATLLGGSRPAAAADGPPTAAQVDFLEELWGRETRSRSDLAARAAEHQAVLDQITTRILVGWMPSSTLPGTADATRTWGALAAQTASSLAAVDAASAAVARAGAELRSYAEMIGVQHTVPPSECPAHVDDELLREGAPGDVCARSVMSAATPHAARAVAEIFSMLGAPYACQSVGRLGPERFDCSSLVTIAYTRAGVHLTSPDWAPTTRDMFPWDGARLAHWATPVDPADARPGDLALYRGSTHHVVMVLSDGYMAHTASCGDVAHVTCLRPFTTRRGFAGVRRVAGVDPVRP